MPDGRLPPNLGPRTATIRMMDDLQLGAIVVPQEPDLVWRATRASGPGGQHVNKTSTAVAVGWDPAPHCTPEQLARLQQRLGSRIDADGLIWVRAQDARSQWRNRQMAITRLQDLVTEALTPQKPRVATVPPPAAEQRRLADKRAQQERKAARRWRPD